MAATVLYMSMSLDGFIAGPNEGPDNGLGDGGHRLHEWLWTDGAEADLANLRSGGVNGLVIDEFMSTGAVVAGRGTFEPAERLGRQPPRRGADLHLQPPGAGHRHQPAGRWSPI